jgi:hypothetical protein
MLHFTRRFQPNACKRQAPNQNEQCPPPSTPERTESKWSVCASDQQKNRAMIENLKDAFGTVPGQCVVKGGSQVQ